MTRAQPSVARVSPATMLMSVVLPAPLGPRSAKISPARTARSTPARATTSPYRFTSPRTSTTGGSTPRNVSPEDAAGLAPAEQGAAPLADLAGEVAAQRLVEARVERGAAPMGQRRLEPARELVLAPGASLEGGPAQPDALL